MGKNFLCCVGLVYPKDYNKYFSALKLVAVEANLADGANKRAKLEFVLFEINSQAKIEI
jgi:hypothetical protein